VRWSAGSLDLLRILFEAISSSIAKPTDGNTHLHIDSTNYAVGNCAMASVLLLYYHLLREGGITNDQTVYVDNDDFNAFDFLDVTAAQGENDIDVELIREGAVIYLLCDLDDVMAENGDDYRQFPYFQRIVAALTARPPSCVPEATAILKLILASEAGNFQMQYRRLLTAVYEKYVVNRIRALLPQTA
jgi:hypothetical protein